MRFGPYNLSYLICFGIAPYFKQQLLVELEETQCFVILFDESLNNELHKEQTDFFVKYFTKDKVVCRYPTSRFLDHTCAEDLKKEFEEGIQELDKKKMVQVSIDGSNVIWKLYDSIEEERNQNDDYSSLIDIGSCSVHIVHVTFRSGLQKTKWGIHGILKAMHNVFDESPSKEKITKILLDLRFFHCLSVDTDGLKTRKLETEILVFGPTLLSM